MLNASRHHRKNRVSRAGIDKPRLHVLNASRHHRKNRSHDPRRTKHERRACSTPRGITGKIAVLLASNAPPVHSAQRLAASPEKSPRHRLNQRILIIVLNASRHHRKNRTPEKIIVDCCHLVLNASRHHRKNRWNDDRKHPTLRGCAQRLAASPEKSPSVAIWSHFAASGAQRLAASPEKSLARSSTTPASRAGAQRLAASPEKSPACAAADRRARSRAQRLAASPEKSPVARMAESSQKETCSTPRGITGKIAPYVPEEEKRRPEVLNASRHHRKNRFGLGIRPAVHVECSTPRGITGKIAVVQHVLIFLQRGECSTPRGITGKIARARRREVHRDGEVLNASRHHRKNRTISPHSIPIGRTVLNASRHHRKNRTCVRSATRSTSRMCSTPRGITGKIAVGGIFAIKLTDRKCSTPRGITGKIAIFKRPSYLSRLKCSTPRGITGKIAGFI